MLKMRLLKYSSFMRARPRRPGLRSRAQDSARIQDIEQGRPLQIQQRSGLISNIATILPSKQEGREILYSGIQARAAKTRWKTRSKTLVRAQELFKLLLLFQATFQRVSYCCLWVSSTPKCRLRSSLDRRKLFVNRCSFVTPVPWYFRTRRLRLIPLRILFFATGN